MFQIDDTKKFYSKEVTKEIRLSWYIFAYKFLICVNSDWLKALSGNKAKLMVNMFKLVSVSDEAFTRWVLEVKYNRCLEDVKNESIQLKKIC